MMILKAILFFIFLFFVSPVLAGVQYTVLGCPASVDVLVGFDWRSTVNITVASNTNSMVLPETPSGVFSSFLFPAKSSSSGSVVLTNSSGVLQSFTCTAVPVAEVAVFDETFLLGLAGIVCGGLIAFTFAKAGQWGSHD